MCDTMVALGNSTTDGSVIFAKNSDRQPNEPLIMIRIPRKHYNQGAKVRCTYIEIDQAEETYEVMLLKPSWMWGCEMGCNEFGLNIGNEAVFTKEKYGKDSLLGMDMVRIALERCRTSEEALTLIIDLLSKYGQGGNCGYEKHFTYHNSFLIADINSAWVLETAGEYWAAEKVKNVKSISNCLTIGREYDRCHPHLVEHAVDKGWCKNEKDFHFAACYGNPLITRFSGSKQRLSASKNILEKEKGSINADTMKKILRSHDAGTEGKQFSKHSLKSICMHGGFLIGDHTTGSYIASLNEKLCTYLITGSSTPCLAVFKPFWMIQEDIFSFNEKEEEAAIDFWRKRELLHRSVLENRVSNLLSYLTERDLLENNINAMIVSLDLNKINEDQLLKIMDFALTKEEALIDKVLCSASNQPDKNQGGVFFRNYWKKQTQSLYKMKGN
ncbi:C69 family dipeptidase [Candidatus Contubernalis alkaliaceticus]|uniref:C69 family dipeptidase n=1 Tax=Candidatus Contubernalis alkaliaceticus TaxID=338645 RepID=UPI001F4C032C|nr:C69 family dipeptidase [Candidatus Contubernalis alkalaceticus]UNC92447.1 C69 family dipeptidase [Candidatus Contubernalis alkalaceticus]